MPRSYIASAVFCVSRLLFMDKYAAEQEYARLLAENDKKAGRRLGRARTHDEEVESYLHGRIRLVDDPYFPEYDLFSTT